LDVNPAETLSSRKHPKRVKPNSRTKRKNGSFRGLEKFGKYALAVSDFNEKVVGGKSLHLAQLRGQLPDWIELPKSVAIPFGVLKSPGLSSNNDVAKLYNDLVHQADAGAPTSSLNCAKPCWPCARLTN